MIGYGSVIRTIKKFLKVWLEGIRETSGLTTKVKISQKELFSRHIFAILSFSDNKKTYFSRHISFPNNKTIYIYSKC